MIIKVLAENTSISDAFGSEHGLSLYIEQIRESVKYYLMLVQVIYLKMPRN